MLTQLFLFYLERYNSGCTFLSKKKKTPNPIPNPNHQLQLKSKENDRLIRMLLKPQPQI